MDMLTIMFAVYFSINLIGAIWMLIKHRRELNGRIKQKLDEYAQSNPAKYSEKMAKNYDKGYRDAHRVAIVIIFLFNVIAWAPRQLYVLLTRPASEQV